MEEPREGLGTQQEGTGTPTDQATATPPAAQPGDHSAMLAELHRRVCSGGNWFYWIAGLSIINTLIAAFHGSMSFVVGLGFTQIVDALISKYGGAVAVVGVPISLIVAGIYAMFGYFACRRARWAFITGMVLYSLDSLIFLLATEWFPLAFHAFALYGISRGLKADSEARRIEAQMSAGIPG